MKRGQRNVMQEIELAQSIVESPVASHFADEKKLKALMAEVARAGDRMRRLARGDLSGYQEAVCSLSGLAAIPEYDIQLLVAVMVAIAPPLEPEPIPGVSKENPFMGECYAYEGDHTVEPLREKCFGLPDHERIHPNCAYDTRLKAQEKAYCTIFNGAMSDIARVMKRLNEERDAATPKTV